MKICFLSDTHLPYRDDAVQNDALTFLCGEAKKAGADYIAAAGDMTADGDPDAARRFLKAVADTGLPAVICPGNSDIRTAATVNEMLSFTSPAVNVFGDFTLISAGDADRAFSPDALAALAEAGKNTAVMMHHPPETLKPESAAALDGFHKRNPDAHIFYAHIHKSGTDGVFHSLPCADPDKAIGEEPGALIFDTETGKSITVHYPCPMPDGFCERLGFTCFDPETDLLYAASRGIKHAELRNIAFYGDINKVLNGAAAFRSTPGSTLSLHAPDFLFDDEGRVRNTAEWKDFIDFACLLSADRITVHTPRCSVKNFDNNILRNELEKFINIHFNELPPRCIIGIENMHMTKGETPDGSHRFGYTPAECKAFAEFCRPLTGHTLGFNIDIGHARNNAPFSEKYTLGAWYAELGKSAVSYHIHQVINTPAGFENHMPFTEPYGALISLASFFKSIESGILNPAPAILEIRGAGEYRKSIDMLFDLADKKSGRHIAENIIQDL